MQWVWLAMTFLVALRHNRLTMIWVWIATVTTLSAGAADDAGVTVTLIVAASALVLIGDLLRARRLASREAERQSELSDLEKARRTVLEERTRIARDLHDVVAHHMSMVVVQAETAPYRLPDLSEAAQAEFNAVSTSAREALNEIRSLLGVLRSDDQAVLTAPQPGVENLEELVESVARSGVPVRLVTSGSPAGVETAVGLSTYRIVQESLANAARHAPGAPVTVHVGYAAGSVDLRIVNGPPAVPTQQGPPGHGLIGMRERASVVGGTLEANPLPDGGFEVSAVIPINAHADSNAVDMEEPSGEQ
ncbi:sensor histidine kinase [Phytoactinopolyspora sp. XMNu-373]|uniref:histidine kinase n=2 Tax=Phytoactinopolyspora mesophila TaxID=2650750 RepID=A0A7K3M0H8_9ACTN|nr:sensor histidine kinase [Phytoactinopolyspora mesophila]